MARVIIINGLKNDVLKKFGKESKKIFKLMHSLGDNPRKGKLLGRVGGIVIKEIKYKSFRFYFVTDGYKLKFFSGEDLTNMLIKFVRMSDKKSQQKTIDEIKGILRKFGEEKF